MFQCGNREAFCSKNNHNLVFSVLRFFRQVSTKLMLKVACKLHDSSFLYPFYMNYVHEFITGSKDHIKVQGEILEGLVARIVSHDSSKHMEKVLKDFPPPPSDGCKPSNHLSVFWNRIWEMQKTSDGFIYLFLIIFVYLIWCDSLFIIIAILWVSSFWIFVPSKLLHFLDNTSLYPYINLQLPFSWLTLPSNLTYFSWIFFKTSNLLMFLVLLMIFWAWLPYMTWYNTFFHQVVRVLMWR